MSCMSGGVKVFLSSGVVLFSSCFVFFHSPLMLLQKRVSRLVVIFCPSPNSV